LIWNSLAWGLALLSKRRPKIPRLPPPPCWLCHTTTNPAPAADADG
jgi:hypothetical protein